MWRACKLVKLVPLYAYSDRWQGNDSIRKLITSAEKGLMLSFAEFRVNRECTLARINCSLFYVQQYSVLNIKKNSQLCFGAKFD